MNFLEEELFQKEFEVVQEKGLDDPSLPAEVCVIRAMDTMLLLLLLVVAVAVIVEPCAKIGLECFKIS